MTMQVALGQRIQSFRKELGLSQERFALSINMDRTYYASVEAGKRNISLANIEKIANGFNITHTPYPGIKSYQRLILQGFNKTKNRPWKGM